MTRRPCFFSDADVRLIRIKGIRPWRRLAKSLQAVVIPGIPFIRVGGESALRFDIPSLRLHFFGSSLWMDEFFIVLAATIFLTFLIVLVTVLFGRIWCGWLCPQTVLSELTGFVDHSGRKGALPRTLSYAGALVISAAVSASLIWYFVSPYEFLGRLAAGNLGDVLWGFWIVLTVILFLDLTLLRRTFCATACPYAKLQGVLFDERTLAIAFDRRRREECMGCEACVRICPVGIDIRKGLNLACISCAECVDACTRMLGPRKRPGLIGYFFGEPGASGGLLRTNVLIVGALTAASLVLSISLVLARTPIGVTVLPNHDFPPRISGRGDAVNSYLLAIENKGRESMTVDIGLAAAFGPMSITPRSAVIDAGGHRRIPVYVTASAPGAGKSAMIEITVMAEGIPSPVTRKITFIYPEKR